MDADTADFSFDDVVAQLEPPEDEPSAGAPPSEERAEPPVSVGGEESSLYGDEPEDSRRRAEVFGDGGPASDEGSAGEGGTESPADEDGEEDAADFGDFQPSSEDSAALGGAVGRGAEAVSAEGLPEDGGSEMEGAAFGADDAVPDDGPGGFDFAAVASALEDGGDYASPAESSAAADSVDDSSEGGAPQSVGVDSAQATVSASADGGSPSGGRDSGAVSESAVGSGGSDSESVGRPALSEDELLVRKEKVLAVMEGESALLDEILGVQSSLRSCVRGKDWDGMNARLGELQSLGDRFSAMEEERESLCGGVDFRRDADVSPLLVQVRGKLQRSRLENRVLNEYISTTRKFLQGVFDSVVPQRRNTLYSRTGRIIRPEPTAVAVDIEL